MNFKNPIYDDITYLKGVGPKRAEELKKYGINFIVDVLHHLPRKYLDRRNIKKINQCKIGEETVIIGKIISKNIKVIGRRRLFQLTIGDETGELQCVWFNGLSWIIEKFNINDQIAVYGKIEFFKGMKITHPDFDILDDNEDNFNTGQIISLYASTSDLKSKGLDSKGFRKIIKNILFNKKYVVEDFLTDEMIAEENLCSLKEALTKTHFPNDNDEINKSIYRLKYNEHFFIQLLMALKKYHIKKNDGISFPNRGLLLKKIYESLNFTLTNAQIRVLREIRSDLKSNNPMNRLIQGDVGSGKTIVALLSCLIAIDNSYQSSIIAPTEILAQQHYNSITNSLIGLNLNVKILTGSTSKKDRDILFKELRNGELNILIGTHAILEDKVVFKNLGLAIIDEQHKFGVAQRSKLWKKNIIPPHILVMTATPIPRTLAMSVYGDLDISIINELPPGRRPIKTVHRTDKKRLQVFKFLKDEIKKGRQIYIVYPLIEESIKMDYKDLMDGYESIEREFPKDKYQISILHGRMKPDDKVYEMNRFKKGETQIMVSTTVIEVGVNIPNASVMIIESAERFGLSQLHQLRGRVGRSSINSYCILMTKERISNDAATRIKTMTNTNDGFKIAEVDMNLRGPGNILGTQQSGLLNFKIADLIKDKEILHLAREDAKILIDKDPQLKHVDNKEIKEEYSRINKNSILWKHIS